MSMLGTVGPPVPYVEVRLESVPEMGYEALSSEMPRGEICIRGDTLFSGYYKREDLTKEVLVDGWFHTGIDLFQLSDQSMSTSLPEKGSYQCVKSSSPEKTWEGLS
jgi:long-subunit acyl-CoA synthetase (AMP-forming)